MREVGLLRRFAPLILGLVVILGMAAKGCQEGPFGRQRLVRISEDQEAALGAQAYMQVLSESRVIEREPIADAVRTIGKRLALASTTPEFRKLVGLKGNQKFDWEFRVLQDKQINAFCLPGGKVAVYTGILPVAETDVGLSVVMGHEIGHALARHGAERMAQNELVQMGQMAVASSLGGMDANSQRLIIGMMGAGTQFGVLLPFSRKHESEADHIGVLLMAYAGYDPREAPRFWERMSKATSGSRQAEFLSTHPNPETRVRDLQLWVDTQALAIYQRNNEKRPQQPLPRVGGMSSFLGERNIKPKANLKDKGFEFD